jgi:aspartate kinase
MPLRIQACARRIAEDVEEGHRVVVVVSAAGRTTDQLEEMARGICPDPPRRELDMLLTAGERISMALLSMALHRQGIPAISFTGSQSGIITDTRHQEARIHRIRPFRILEELNKGRVVIVAGFQGVSAEKEVTTLGRGGSDTTAVALAVVFAAPWCGIFSDVAGVLSADPSIVPEARPVEAISLDALTVLSHLGAGVVSRRASALARKFGMPLWISHSHESGRGTWALSKESGPPPEDSSQSFLSFREVESVESANVLSVTMTNPAWKMTTSGTDWSRTPGAPSPLYVHVEEREGIRHVTAVFDGDPPAELPAGVTCEANLALVSLVGEGSMSHPELLKKGSKVLEGMGVLDAFAEGLALSFLVPASRADESVRRLHGAFIATP